MNFFSSHGGGCVEMRPFLLSFDLVNVLQEMHLFFYSSTSDSGITYAGEPLGPSPTPQPHTEPLHISPLGHSNECFTFILLENQLQIPAEIHWMKRAVSVFIRYQLHRGQGGSRRAVVHVPDGHRPVLGQIHTS